MSDYEKTLVRINRAYEDEDFDLYEERASRVRRSVSASRNGRSRTTPLMRGTSGSNATEGYDD